MIHCCKVLCAAAALAALAAPTQAQVEPDAVHGVFVVTTADDSGIKAAIDDAVAKMNFLFRSIARGRLLDTNPRYQRIEIGAAGSQVSVQFDRRKPILMPTGGSAVKWTREDGEVFDVSARMQAGLLTQTFSSDEGQRVNEFRLHPDGTLSLDVSVTSPRLPQPVRYTLQFQRAGD